MRNSDWGGNPPANHEEARQKLLQAALVCAEKFGLAKINIKRVAEEVGVTQQTVYRYFPTSEELVAATSFAVGGQLINELQLQLANCQGFEQKVLESICFLARRIPDDPFLSQYFSAQPQYELNRQQVLGDATLDYTFHALKSMYTDGKTSEAEEVWLRGLTEHILRTVLALILTPSPQTSTEQGLRDYLTRWFLPLLQAAPITQTNNRYSAD